MHTQQYYWLIACQLSTNTKLHPLHITGSCVPNALALHTCGHDTGHDTPISGLLPPTNAHQLAARTVRCALQAQLITTMVVVAMRHHRLQCASQSDNGTYGRYLSEAHTYPHAFRRNADGQSKTACCLETNMRKILYASIPSIATAITCESHSRRL